ncbi:MAG: SDR family NAD(P)-dependent oxidoreductase [Halioglobus sp.]
MPRPLSSASKWAMEGLCESLAQEMAGVRRARVSIIEPGCVATPMWTKGTPSDAPPLYPVTLSRLVRFFEVGLSTPAQPADVARAIEQVIIAEDPPFRVPVGKDAEEVIAGRENTTGDEWIRMLCTAGDKAFAAGWQAVVGRDYYTGSE